MFLSRRTLVTLFALAAIPVATIAHAGESEKFTEAAFAAAQEAGKSILVDISATWCPTCKAQAPIIRKLSGEEKYKNLVVFDVDFDSQKDVVKALGARMQSTLIGFKGSKETGRSAGDTNPMTIEDLVESTL